MFLLRYPDAERLQRLWAGAVNSSLSYEEVGATAGPGLPRGYRHNHLEMSLRGGSERFDKAVAALRSWQMHVRSGLGIFPEGEGLVVDQTILVVVRLGLFTTVAPCRVVYLVDEVDRFGFAYGTLPGHPETGRRGIPGRAFRQEFGPIHDHRLFPTSRVARSNRRAGLQVGAEKSNDGLPGRNERTDGRGLIAQSERSPGRTTHPSGIAQGHRTARVTFRPGCATLPSRDGPPTSH